MFSNATLWKTLRWWEERPDLTPLCLPGTDAYGVGAVEPRLGGNARRASHRADAGGVTA